MSRRREEPFASEDAEAYHIPTVSSADQQGEDNNLIDPRDCVEELLRARIPLSVLVNSFS